MKLSIIIVNYNVRYFLEQCLHSVMKACQDIPSEVFVVDNNSVDGSCAMVKEKFPGVVLIENAENMGFSRANNLAIKRSQGEYVLLLNPDTIVEQDTFNRTIDFMDTHAEAGALGVKMIDGKGRFLPESKRGLPTPLVAFYKIFGLSALFPKSKTFGKYHLGYLNDNETHEVEILAGAFMMLRKSALEQTGLLDETFFMYGEDIDLSYRILKAGFKNYYFSETRIVHYKGESTKKSSINYVFVFYRAMIIFAQKHFSQQHAWVFSLMIHMAIYLRAFVAVVSRMLDHLLLPLLDATIFFAGIFLMKEIWEIQIFGAGGSYPSLFLFAEVPAFIFFWIFTVWITGGYDKPVSIGKIIKGLSLGTLIILVLYSLLPETLRFSRALILFGFAWCLLVAPSLRLFLYHGLKITSLRLDSGLNRRIIIIGEKDEAGRVASLVRNAMPGTGFIGLVSPDAKVNLEEGFIGQVHQIHEIIEIYRIDEVIFCGKDIPARLIIDKMSELQDLRVELKIAPPESLSIIGSKSINTAGDLYIVDIDSINRIENRRKKLLMDLILSVILLAFSPLLILFIKNPLGLFKNIILTLFQRRSWVGFYLGDTEDPLKLPNLRKGVLNPLDAFPGKNINSETIDKLNLLYSRDYKISNDFYIFRKGFRELGR
ncbi:MAG: glycosyltransferase [Bacteroidota bacterium]